MIKIIKLHLLFLYYTLSFFFHKSIYFLVNNKGLPSPAIATTKIINKSNTNTTINDIKNMGHKKQRATLLLKKPKGQHLLSLQIKKGFIKQSLE